jgi:hypothetical protein
MDEADYVSAILQDPIAKAVKEADKVHNLREAVLCGDNRFRKWYAKKAKKYYYRKFSASLDTVIDLALKGKIEKTITDAVITVPKDTGIIPAMPVPKDGIIPAWLVPEGMHKPGKNRRTKEFDARDPENAFYMDARYDDSYICDPGSESGTVGETQVYALTRNGWKAEHRDMVTDFDMYIEQTREEMDTIISELYERGWFHDGVCCPTLHHKYRRRRMKEKLFERFFNLLDEASGLLNPYDYFELLNSMQDEVEGRISTLDFGEEEA